MQKELAECDIQKSFPKACGHQAKIYVCPFIRSALRQAVYYQQDLNLSPSSVSVYSEVKPILHITLALSETAFNTVSHCSEFQSLLGRLSLSSALSSYCISVHASADVQLFSSSIIPRQRCPNKYFQSATESRDKSSMTLNRSMFSLFFFTKQGKKVANCNKYNKLYFSECSGGPVDINA